MTDTERIAALEMTVEILRARLDAMDKSYDGPILPGIEISEPKLTEPELVDPDEFYQSLFSMPIGEIAPDILLEDWYGVKLLHIGKQFLGIGAMLESRYKKLPDIFMDFMTAECGENWFLRFQRYADQSGLTDTGTGVPHGLPCKMHDWVK